MPRPPARNDVTLTGRGGVELILFAPRAHPDGLEADAVYVSRAIPKRRILRLGNRKFRVPAIPGPDFHVATVLVVEIK